MLSDGKFRRKFGWIAPYGQLYSALLFRFLLEGGMGLLEWPTWPVRTEASSIFLLFRFAGVSAVSDSPAARARKCDSPLIPRTYNRDQAAAQGTPPSRRAMGIRKSPALKAEGPQRHHCQRWACAA